MRYWLNGEDEDYDRELARVSRFGGARPASLSRSDVAGVVFLIGIHVVAFVSLIASFLVSLR